MTGRDIIFVVNGTKVEKSLRLKLIALMYDFENVGIFFPSCSYFVRESHWFKAIVFAEWFS